MHPRRNETVHLVMHPTPSMVRWKAVTKNNDLQEFFFKGKRNMKLLVLDGGRSSYLDVAMRVIGGYDHDLSVKRKTLLTASLSITNEAILVDGENVGGATAAPAAPEVAGDDDGDGDGDGDPDPERRRPGRPCNTRNTLPSTVENFDRLPDSACLDIAALKAITGKSRATLYRWIDKGILPKPRKLGLTSNNVWAAGEIRRALSA